MLRDLSSVVCISNPGSHSHNPGSHDSCIVSSNNILCDTCIFLPVKLTCSGLELIVNTICNLSLIFKGTGINLSSDGKRL